jgi:DNA repair exonuclease SbcCD ATPase subunit
VQERLEELLRLLDENPDLLEALQERIVDEKAILRALEKRAETREAIRRLVLRDDFLQLPDLVRQLIEAQLRNEAQLQEHNRLIRQLIESQQRHEAILQENARQLRELTAQVQRVVAVQEQMARDLHDFKEWRKGFEGLRGAQSWRKRCANALGQSSQADAADILSRPL